MLLNQTQIKALKLISGSYKDREPASVPLTINTIIANDKEINTSTHDKTFTIPPQGMVLAISNEIFNLEPSKRVLGYTTVKNSMSRAGIWALNIGIVDSDWNGPIGSVLINFGKQPYILEVNEEFLRMTFHSFDRLANEDLSKLISDKKGTSFTLSEYIKMRKNEYRLRMDDKFLVLNQLESTITSNVKKSILATASSYGIVLALIGGIMGIATYVSGRLSSERTAKEYLDNVVLTQKNEYLQGSIDSLSKMNQRNAFRLDSIYMTMSDIEHKLNHTSAKAKEK